MMNIKILNQTQKLYDKYEIYLNRIIGSGSYSNVYLGRILDKKIIEENNLTSEMVAIKKIKMENIDQKSFKLINDEINIMQKIKNYKIKCPNIIKCFDIFEEFDFIYLVLEYCDNGDLSKIIGKPIREQIVKYYFSQIITALYFLCENNIIHRDIKPKNILLKNNKKDLILCDFGFARFKSSSMQRVNTICGSPLYMAPELLEEKSYTEIVDIWAIGMILYEMIYGEHPYHKCKDLEDLKEFSKKDIMIPPKNNSNKDISNDCIDLMQKMLNKEEKDRITLNNLFNHAWIKDTLKINYKLINNTIKEESEESEESDESDDSDKSKSNSILNSSKSSNNSCIFLGKNSLYNPRFDNTSI
jgi:serine/threonine-protein kinase ULK/ATG1